MFGTFAFIFGFTKLGMINKVFFACIISQTLVFIHKLTYYQRVIEDIST